MYDVAPGPGPGGGGVGWGPGPGGGGVGELGPGGGGVGDPSHLALQFLVTQATVDGSHLRGLLLKQQVLKGCVGQSLPQPPSF